MARGTRCRLRRQLHFRSGQPRAPISPASGAHSAVRRRRAPGQPCFPSGRLTKARGHLVWELRRVEHRVEPLGGSRPGTARIRARIRQPHPKFSWSRMSIRHGCLASPGPIDFKSRFSGCLPRSPRSKHVQDEARRPETKPSQRAATTAAQRPGRDGDAAAGAKRPSRLLPSTALQATRSRGVGDTARRPETKRSQRAAAAGLAGAQGEGDAARSRDG